MNNTIKTRTVRFSFGTVKGAALQIPAQPTNLVTVARLIRESYLAWMFSKPAIMSDECLLSCIGRDNFEAGALGGWETRLDAKSFAMLKDLVNDDTAMALAIVRYRNANASERTVWSLASKIEGLSAEVRAMMQQLAALKAA
jgi:hypothetical protein